MLIGIAEEDENENDDKNEKHFGRQKTEQNIIR